MYSIRLSNQHNNQNIRRRNNTLIFFFQLPIVILFCLFLFLSLSTSKIKPKNQIQLRRLYNEDVNDEQSEKTAPKITKNIPNKTTLETLYSTEYEFINNLTKLQYIGSWSALKVENNILEKSNGVCELYFGKQKGKNFILDLSEDNSFRVVFYIKDGDYIDQYIRTNFTMLFPKNFSNVLEKSENDNVLKFENLNTTVDYEIRQFLLDFNKFQENETNITLTFHNKEKVIKTNLEQAFVVKYSSIDLQIKGPTFSVKISGEVTYSEEFEKKVRNYSFSLTLIAVAEMFCILTLLNQVKENSQIGLNLDLITIIISILYKSLICSVHVYLFMTSSDDLFFEYGIPSVLYFFSFSRLELQLLFFSWKSRYNELMFTAPHIFKRKLFCFYINFYILLFTGLISIKMIITSTFLCFTLFTMTWLFQIIHSIRTGTRPPMSYLYIFVSSIGKLYLPIYLKGYSGNFFELKPSYLKVGLIVSIVLIQVFILGIQKNFGARSIVPGCCKKLPYNYYRDEVNIKEHISKNPDCVICLSSLENGASDFEDENELNKKPQNIIENVKQWYVVGFFIAKLEQWFSSENKKKKLMVTPCDHVFHTTCLEKWMELKNECPYCRTKIPPLE